MQQKHDPLGAKNTGLIMSTSTFDKFDSNKRKILRWALKGQSVPEWFLVNVGIFSAASILAS